jgi:hypothetical protein
MPARTQVGGNKKSKKHNKKVKKLIILLMAGLMIMPACKSSLLNEHNNYSSSPYVPEEPLLFHHAASASVPELTPYVPEEPLLFHLFAFFYFCAALCGFVSVTKLQLDGQEITREQMKNYIKEKKRYDLKFLRSRYANGIIKYRFYSYPPYCPKPVFDNFTKITYYYLYRYLLVVLMSMCSYVVTNGR